MPDLLEMLRLGSIFSGENSPQDISGNNILEGLKNTDTFNSPIPVQTTPEITPANRINQRMQELYQPSTQASDKYNSLLNNYPQYERPSLGRIALGALAAFGPGGQKAGMDVINEPFNRKVTDWKNKIGPAERAANLEKSENINARTNAYQTVSAEIRAEADAARQANDARKADISQQRADIYALKATNPNYKFDFSGPEVLMADPATGKVEKTGIQTGNLTVVDKLALQHENRMAEIKESGSQARQTKETMPAKAPSVDKVKNPTETNIRQGRANRARELLEGNPELKDYINIEGNNYSLNAPSKGWFRNVGEKETYDKIVDYIQNGGTNPFKSGNKKLTPEDIDKKIEDILKAAGKPITPANKEYLRKQLGQ